MDCVECYLSLFWCQPIGSRVKSSDTMRVRYRPRDGIFSLSICVVLITLQKKCCSNLLWRCSPREKSKPVINQQFLDPEWCLGPPPLTHALHSGLVCPWVHCTAGWGMFILQFFFKCFCLDQESNQDIMYRKKPDWAELSYDLELKMKLNDVCFNFCDL